MSLKVGDIAPDFTLPSTAGKNFTLSEALKNSKRAIILYFYPGDFSTLCTWEACGFRDEIEPFNEMNAEVIGISTDNMESHRKFIKKYSLPFQLLSDPAGEVCKLFDSYRGILGRASRMTFVIDPDQRIRAIHNEVVFTGKHVSGAKIAMMEIEDQTVQTPFELEIKSA